MKNCINLCRFLLILCCLNASFFSRAQVGIAVPINGYEIGLNFGAMNFLGDLGGNRGKGTAGPKDLNLPVTHLAFGISAAYYPVEWFGLRIAGNIGRVEGYDNLIFNHGTEEVPRIFRDLHFRSPIYEAYTGIEIYPTCYIREKRELAPPRLKPFLLAGVGLFHFQPHALYNNGNGNQRWVQLRPLRTEGQGMEETGRPEYATIAMSFPVGIGFKYDIKERLTLSIEFIHRYTNTDYIDDVSTTYIDPVLFDRYLSPSDAAMAKILYNPSARNTVPIEGYGPNIPGNQRGNPKRNDGFLSTQFRFTWKLGDLYAYWFKNKRSIFNPRRY